MPNLVNASMDFWPELFHFVGGCIALPDQWIYCLTGLFSGPCHWKCRHWSLAKRAIHHLPARILGARLCIARFVEILFFKWPIIMKVECLEDSIWKKGPSKSSKWFKRSDKNRTDEWVCVIEQMWWKLWSQLPFWTATDILVLVPWAKHCTVTERER